MTARLIDSLGHIVREWQTDRPDLAMTADRNCPVGWRVELASHEKETTK
jgi:hypothetical protein